MTDPIPPELEKELVRLTAALAHDLGLAPPAPRPLAGILHATVKDGVLAVPAQHVAHWKRFGVLPSALVRDVAYACKKAQMQAVPGLSGATVEADSMAYAERFLRAATDADDEPE